VKSFDLPNNHQSTVEPSVAESDTMSALASVQDTIDGSISQPAGTPSTITTPALMPPSGQVGKQGIYSLKRVYQELELTTRCVQRR
jgi:hypothetical protein